MEDTYTDDEDSYDYDAPYPPPEATYDSYESVSSGEIDFGDREPLPPLPKWPEGANAKYVFGSDGWLQWRQEVIDDWKKAFPNMQQPIDLVKESAIYNGDLSQTIIFCMEYTSWKKPEVFGSQIIKYWAEVFAINSSDGNLYRIALHQFDNRFVEYAIDGEIIYFLNPDRSASSYYPTPCKMETYNIRTNKWDSINGELDDIKRLWPDTTPVHSSAVVLSLGTMWAKYFRCCILDKISFCFEKNTMGEPCLIVRKQKDDVNNNSLTQISDDDDFVPDHEIDLSHYLKDCRDNEYSQFYLNHITGLRFCLHIFFSEDNFPVETSSVCIFNFELAKVKAGPIKIQDDPDQFKARKGETFVFKIHSTLDPKYFELPWDDFPRSCVKQENGQSRRLPMTRT